MRYLAIALLALLLVGCAPAPVGNGEPNNHDMLQISGTVLTGVYRTVDSDAGVVRWVFSSVEKGGIDCMPIGETRLAQ